MDTQINNVPVTVRELGTREIFKSSWKFYKENFKRLWPIFLVAGFTSVRFNQIGDFIQNKSLIIIAIILSIIIGVFAILSKVSLYKAISDLHKGKKLTLKDMYRNGVFVFWPFILVTIITSITLLGSYTLLIIPGFILTVYLRFAIYEVIDRDKRGIGALLCSWEIVSGRWVDVFVRYFKLALLLIILLIPVFIVIAFIGIVSFVLLSLVNNSQLTEIFTAFLAIFYYLFNALVVSPLIMIPSFKLYLDIRDNNPIKQAENLQVNKKRKLKIIVSMIIGIIAFLATIVGGIYLIKKLPNQSVIIPKSGYFTFRSEADIFSINYPANWKVGDEYVRSDSIYEHGVYFAPNKIGRNKANPKTSIELHIGSIDNSMTIDEFGKKLGSKLLDNGNIEKDTFKMSTSTVSGRLSYEYSYIEHDDVSTTTLETTSMVVATYTVKDGYYFGLSYYSDPNDNQKDIGVYRRMLNSWNINRELDREGDNIKYINDEYGFSYKFPSTWIDFNSQPDIGIISSVVEPAYSEGYLYGNKQIYVYVNNFYWGLESYKNLFTKTKAFGEENNLKDYKVIEVKKINMAGEKGYFVVYSHDDGKKDSVAFIVKNGRVYRLGFLGIDSEDPIIQQTISSFDLIN